MFPINPPPFQYGRAYLGMGVNFEVLGFSSHLIELLKHLFTLTVHTYYLVERIPVRVKIFTKVVYVTHNWKLIVLQVICTL